MYLCGRYQIYGCGSCNWAGGSYVLVGAGAQKLVIHTWTDKIQVPDDIQICRYRKRSSVLIWQNAQRYIYFLVCYDYTVTAPPQTTTIPVTKTTALGAIDSHTSQYDSVITWTNCVTIDSRNRWTQVKCRRPDGKIPMHYTHTINSELILRWQM